MQLLILLKVLSCPGLSFCQLLDETFLAAVQVGAVYNARRKRSVVSCVRGDHRNRAIFNAIVRCIFRASVYSRVRLFLNEQFLPAGAIHLPHRVALGICILRREVYQIVLHHAQRISLGYRHCRTVAVCIIGISFHFIFFYGRRHCKQSRCRTWRGRFATRPRQGRVSRILRPSFIMLGIIPSDHVPVQVIGVCASIVVSITITVPLFVSAASRSHRNVDPSVIIATADTPIIMDAFIVVCFIDETSAPQRSTYSSEWGCFYHYNEAHLYI